MKTRPSNEGILLNNLRWKAVDNLLRDQGGRAESVVGRKLLRPCQGGEFALVTMLALAGAWGLLAGVMLGQGALLGLTYMIQGRHNICMLR